VGLVRIAAVARRPELHQEYQCRQKPRGIRVYTKGAKSAAVGVPSELIDKHTAVSRELALAMARGGLERNPADAVRRDPLKSIRDGQTLLGELVAA
jgi:hypothetical protein